MWQQADLMATIQLIQLILSHHITSRTRLNAVLMLVLLDRYLSAGNSNTGILMEGSLSQLSAIL